MNPDRWAKITESFALERLPQSDTNHATTNENIGSCKVHDDKKDDDTYILGSKEDKETHSALGTRQQRQIGTLKLLLKDKMNQIMLQQQIILSLNETIVHNKICKTDVCDSSTQTEYPCQDACFLSFNDKKSESPSVMIMMKVDSLAERLDAFTESMWQHSISNSINATDCNAHKFAKNSSSIVHPVVKSWNRPPLTQPKPTHGSTMREIHNRKNSNIVDKKPNNGHIYGHDDNELMTASRYEGIDNCYAEFEQRIHFLESLVLQLKRKAMTKLKKGKQ